MSSVFIQSEVSVLLARLMTLRKTKTYYGNENNGTLAGMFTNFIQKNDIYFARFFIRFFKKHGTSDKNANSNNNNKNTGLRTP